MATKKTIQLEVDTNSQDAQKQFDNLRKSIADTTQQLEKFTGTEKENSKEADNLRKQLADLDVEYGKLSQSNTDLGATFEDVFGEIKPLTAQMGEMEDRLYQMALAGDTASKEYKELLTEVGKYKRIQQDTDMIVDGAATTMSQKLGGAIQGVAGGFAVAQGAMALMGTESEKFEETMIKLNAAMAISQGIAGLGESKKAFKAMGLSAKTALKGIKTGVAATGIGVFLVLLGGVVAYWDDIKDLVTDIGAEQKQLNLQAEDNVTLQQSKLDSIGGQENILKEQGKSEKDILRMKIAQTDEVIAATEKLIAGKKIASKLEIEQLRRNQKIAEGFAEVTLKIATGMLRIITFPIDGMIKVVNKVSRALGQGNVVTFSLNKKLDQMIKKGSKLAAGMLFDPVAAKKEADLEIESAEKTLETLLNNRAGYNLSLKTSTADTNKTEVESAEDKAKRLEEIENERIANVKRLKEEFKTELEAETEIANARLLSEQEIEERIVQDKYFRLIEMAKQYGLDTAVLEENQAAALKEIDDKYLKEKADAQKVADDKDAARREKELVLERELQAKKFKMAHSALSAIGDLATAFAGESEAQQKRAFEINKAVSLAQAIMSTAQGIMVELSHPAKALTFTNYASAAIVAATGAAQIATIAKTKFKGGGGGSPPTAPGGEPSSSEGMSQPSFNVVGDSGINQLAQLQMAPTQAYVVSGNITTAQSLDRNKIENATI